MKNNFKEPRYIIPLIILPFIFLFNFMYLDMFAEKEVVSNLEEKESLITTIPKPDLEKLNIDDKLDNLKKNFKEYQDFSAMSENISEDEQDINTDIEESLYSEEEAKQISALRDSLKNLKTRNKENQSAFYNNGSNPGTSEHNSYSNQKKKLQKEEVVRNPAEMFAKEMRKIDSLMNPEKYSREEHVEKLKIMETEKTVRVSQVKTITSLNHKYFNTISAKKTHDNRVEALIDERLKVHEGSRVRLKLGSDIMIDSVEVKKNNYIYAVVSGFSSQRIMLDVTNIVVDGKIYDVEMSLYDQDGMKGLYIPSSKFREFSKQLGSETAQGMGQSSGGLGEDPNIAMKMAQSMTQVTTKAIGAFIKKNRAHLKYNTNIYLINEKK